MMWQQLDSISQEILLNFVALFEECILHTNPDQHYYFKEQDGDSYFCSQIPFPLMNGIISAQLMASQNAKGIVDQFAGEVYSRFTPLCKGFNLDEMKA